MPQHSQASIPSPAISLGNAVMIQAVPTVDLGTGGIRQVDLRLYRRSQGGVGLYPTSAGFRVPVERLRDLAALLNELADALDQARGTA